MMLRQLTKKAISIILTSMMVGQTVTQYPYTYIYANEVDTETSETTETTNEDTETTEPVEEVTTEESSTDSSTSEVVEPVNLTNNLDQIDLSVKEWKYGDQTFIDKESKTISFSKIDEDAFNNGSLSMSAQLTFQYLKDGEERDIHANDYFYVTFPTWMKNISLSAATVYSGSDEDTRTLLYSEKKNNEDPIFKYEFDEDENKVKVTILKEVTEDEIEGNLSLKFDVTKASLTNLEDTWILQKDEKDESKKKEYKVKGYEEKTSEEVEESKEEKKETEKEETVEEDTTEAEQSEEQVETVQDDIINEEEVVEEEEEEKDQNPIVSFFQGLFSIFNSGNDDDDETAATVTLTLNGSSLDTVEQYSQDDADAKLHVTWNDNHTSTDRPEDAETFLGNVQMYYTLKKVTPVKNSAGTVIDYAEVTEDEEGNPVESTVGTYVLDENLYKDLIQYPEGDAFDENNWDISFGTDEKNSALPKIVSQTVIVDGKEVVEYYSVEYSASTSDLDEYLDESSYYDDPECAETVDCPEMSLFYTKKATFTATIEWKDNNGIYGTRPSTEDILAYLNFYQNVAGNSTESPLDTEKYTVLDIKENEDGSYTVTYSDIPQYKFEGNLYVYSMKEDVTSGKGLSFDDELEWEYSQLYDNSNNNYTNVTDAIYSGGVITNTLTATDTLSFDHYWEDGKKDGNYREGKSTMRLYRTAEDENHEVDLSDSPVKGESSLSTPVKNPESWDPDTESYYNFNYHDGAEYSVFDANGCRYVYYIRVETSGDYKTIIKDQDGTVYDDITITGDGINSSYILNSGKFITRLESATPVDGRKEYHIASMQEINKSDLKDSYVMLALEYHVEGETDGTYHYFDLKKDTVNGKKVLTWEENGNTRTVYTYNSDTKQYEVNDSREGWPDTLTEQEVTVSGQTYTFLMNDDAEYAYEYEDGTYRLVIFLDDFRAEKMVDEASATVPTYDFDGNRLTYQIVEDLMALSGGIYSEFKDIDGLQEQLMFIKDESGNEVGPGVGTKYTTAEIKASQEENGTIVNRLVGDMNVVIQKTWVNHTSKTQDGYAEFVLYRNGIELSYENKANLTDFDDLIFDDANKAVYIKTALYDEEEAEGKSYEDLLLFTDKRLIQ